MHLLRLLRIFIPLLLLAAIVAGGVVVVTSRSDLQRSRKEVDTRWTPLRNDLDSRYDALAAANDAVRPVPGPLHQIVSQVATTSRRPSDSRSLAATTSEDTPAPCRSSRCQSA